MTLKLVLNPETGEVLPELECAECQRKTDEIAGLERDIRAWARRYADLKRDRTADAKAHDMWPVGHRVFAAWRRQCRHPRSVFTADRFWLIEPFLTNGKYGKTAENREQLCMRAVAGAAYDAFEVKRKNGSVKRFDEFDRIFETAGKFEEFANKAPRDWKSC